MSIRIRSERIHELAACVLAFAITITCTHVARAGDDSSLDPYRERFKAGLEHYRAGEYDAAITTWGAIYKALGAARGYRIAFDLARAYEANRDLSHAAEFYLAFVDQVGVRRESGDAITPFVGGEESGAIARLRELDAKQGHIVVDAGAQPVDVKIDNADPRPAGFVAYVEPGSHTITLSPGTPASTTRRIEVAAGGVFEIAPSSMTPATSALAPSLAPLAPEAAFPIRKVSNEIITRHTEHPISPWIVGVTGGAALVSIIVPAAAYVSATSFQASNHLSAVENDPRNATVQSSYDKRVNTFYGTLAIPIVLGVATGALMTWYFAGAKDHEVVETGGVTASASPHGVSVGFTQKF
ncbi:MAG: hypothetical protein ABI183_14955 [Polyangiaceae bacterium]